MFCRNCGNIMNDQAAICVACGVPKGKGLNFCHVCGEQTLASAHVCMKCGASLVATGEQKSRLVAGLLGIFLGVFGVHRFYLGYTTIGVVQLCLTVLTCFVLSPISALWGFIEGIMLISGSGITKDANGNPLKD